MTKMAAGVAIVIGVVLSSAASMPAQAAESCVAGCTVSFAAGSATWTAPSDLADLRVTVAAGAGGENLYRTTTIPDGSTSVNLASSGGAGGEVTVDLGADYAGTTLQLLVGAKGVATEAADQAAPGGGGSYLAADGRLLVVAGGGGGEGYAYQLVADGGDIVPVSGTQQGGAGGFSGSSPDGGDGISLLGGAGPGAVGAQPGAATPNSATQAHRRRSRRMA